MWYHVGMKNTIRINDTVWFRNDLGTPAKGTVGRIIDIMGKPLVSIWPAEGGPCVALDEHEVSATRKGLPTFTLAR